MEDDRAVAKEKAASLLGLSPKTLGDRRWRVRVGLHAVRVGRRLRFQEKEILQLLEKYIIRGVMMSSKVFPGPGPDKLTCRRCGGDNPITQPRGQHLGLYCASCGKWLKWLPQGRPISVMPFGKHRGKAIKDLPDAYLNWILENLDLKGGLFRALSEEYERRGKVAA